MNCPHCSKVIVVKLLKDSNVGQGQPEEVDVSDVGELLALVNPATLDDKSMDFFNQTKERYEQYHDRIRMSPKQMAWLRKLANPETVEDSW